MANNIRGDPSRKSTRDWFWKKEEHSECGYIIVLLGEKDHPRRFMDRFGVPITPVDSDCVVAQNSTVRVVSVPDIFDANNKYLDQHVIDCMALSLPRPNIFILVIGLDEKNIAAINVKIKTLQDIFGDMTKSLVVMLHKHENIQPSHQIKEHVDAFLITTDENLTTRYKDWCDTCKPFKYSYNSYSENVVMRRCRVLSKQRVICDGAETAMASATSTPASKKQGRLFNIILLGLTGTGKSASANTILKAAKSKTQFESFSNSVPVTLKCQSKKVKLFGSEVTVVDTPDFFHENINRQEQLEECKTFMTDDYMVLLVVKVSRFTDEERGIMEKLECSLNTRIRDKTLLLLTCGEEVQMTQLDYLQQNPELRKLFDQCKYGVHFFKNKEKNPKQVQKLIQKFHHFHNYKVTESTFSTPSAGVAYQEKWDNSRRASPVQGQTKSEAAPTLLAEEPEPLGLVHKLLSGVNVPPEQRLQSEWCMDDSL